MSVLFPKWFNGLPTVAAAGSFGGLCVVIGGFWYWATPEFWEVGYMPKQPGLAGFSHQIHAGKLGMDCRYCHTKVEQSNEANIPNVATCYGCHADNHVSLQFARAPQTDFIRAAFKATQDAQGEPIEGGESIPWKRVHKLPDYVRNFPHAAHVHAGVSCFSCHGQITGMPVVYQAHSLSMSWCLDCHRDVAANPEKHLVPRDKVTKLQWVQDEWPKHPEAPSIARQLVDSLKLQPPENCGACHY